MHLYLHQISKPLDETMYISRGGFSHRTHSILELVLPCKQSLYAEVIGDASLIHYLSSSLTIYLKQHHPHDIDELFSCLFSWENSYVYLEPSSSVYSLTCAFDWLRVLYVSFTSNQSLLSVLGLPEPRSFKVPVYGSNIYWKSTDQEFNSQIENFDFSKTNVLKAHLGRNSPQNELEYYIKLASNSSVQGFMVDLNCGYDMTTTAKLANILEEHPEISNKLIWIEEPTHPSLSRLWAKQLTVPIAAGENHHSLQSIEDLSVAGIKWLMPDLGRTLRISDISKLIQSTLHNSLISFHNYSSGFLAYTSLLLTAGLPYSDTWFEYDFSSNALLDDVLQGSITFKNGYAVLEPSALFSLNLKSISPIWETLTYEVI